MSEPRVGMVFTHPGHELPLAGMIQRYRSHILYVTKADSAGEDDREALTPQGLAALGLADRVTFLSMSEPAANARIFAGDASYFQGYAAKILDWLHRVRPSIVFGDAFEHYNFHHDLTRAMLDWALRQYRRQSADVQNCECPLVCRTEPGLDQLRFQQFPHGAYQVTLLSADEVEAKVRMLDVVARQSTYVRDLARHFVVHREVFRAVPWDRDYSVPSPGLRMHYEEWGREQVRRGRYAQPLLFREHFVPLAASLGLCATARPLRAAA